MNFSEYSKKLYNNLSGIHNQGQFVGALFNVAGSTRFPLRPEYGADSYQKKLFSGAKPLTQEMKDSFPKPIDKEKLYSFFQMRIGPESLPKIMSNFGIPSDEVQNKDLFISALCTQFQNIVSEAANDLDDVVLSEYLRLLHEAESNNIVETDVINLLPLYPDDDILLVSELSTQRHSVGFYEIFEHTWKLKNNGSVIWEDRRLECVNQFETKIKALNTTIEIPKVEPGGCVILSAQFDARGIEGSYESLWIMKDRVGRKCFTEESRTLKMVVSVENRRNDPTEVY